MNMHFIRFWTILKARNREFFRDRSAFGWNFLFPFLIVAGFGIIFGGQTYTEYKIGVFPHPPGPVNVATLRIPDQLRTARYLKFIGMPSEEEGISKLKYHKIDFLLKQGLPPYDYWISDGSPKGYVVEQMFKASLIPQSMKTPAQKKQMQGKSTLLLLTFSIVRKDIFLPFSQSCQKRLKAKQ